MKKNVIFFLALAAWLYLACPAMATHYHFEELFDGDVSFTSSTTYIWHFDLDEDNLSLWKLPEVENQNNGESYSPSDHNYAGIGNMDPDDTLHWAYLSIRFDGVNDGNTDCDDEKIDLYFDASQQWDNYLISQGGADNNFDVTAYLVNDHEFELKITKVSGEFTVDWVNLSGCFTPVPEPATLILLSGGFAMLAGLARRGKRAEG